MAHREPGRCVKCGGGAMKRKVDHRPDCPILAEQQDAERHAAVKRLKALLGSAIELVHSLKSPGTGGGVITTGPVTGTSESGAQEEAIAWLDEVRDESEQATASRPSVSAPRASREEWLQDVDETCQRLSQERPGNL